MSIADMPGLYGSVRRRVVPRRDVSPAILAKTVMGDVIFRPPFRIAHDLIRLVQLSKPAFVAGILVVGMETLGQKTVNTVNRL
jgi:hypothetical protein